MWFYYNDGCLTCDAYIPTSKFESKESCIDWWRDRKYIRSNENDSFECWKNCRKDKWLYWLYICEETYDWY